VTDHAAETIQQSMETQTSFTAASKRARWIGWIMSVLPVLLFLMSGVMKLVRPPMVVEGFKHLGLPEQLILPIAIVELACALVYVIPRTAVLGAILLTGFLGGAMLAHLRVSEAVYAHVLFGVFIWGGLFLRDPRLRALIPLRR
jgi:hypothetical protein